MKFGGFNRLGGAAAAAMLAAALSTRALAAAPAAPAASRDLTPVPTAEPAFGVVNQVDAPETWFPQTDDSAAARPGPLRIAQSPGTLLPRERPLIPIPPGALTGLMGLGGVATFVSRKALLRFMT